MSDPFLVENDPVSVDSAPGRLMRFLRRRHPAKTAEAVSAAAGVPAETVRRWLREGAVWPSGEHMISLVAAYGPALLAAVAPPLPWLDDAARAEERARLSRESAALARRLAELER